MDDDDDRIIMDMDTDSDAETVIFNPHYEEKLLADDDDNDWPVLTPHDDANSDAAWERMETVPDHGPVAHSSRNPPNPALTHTLTSHTLRTPNPVQIQPLGRRPPLLPTPRFAPRMQLRVPLNPSHYIRPNLHGIQYQQRVRRP